MNLDQTILEQWDASGLLKGVPENRKEIVAGALQQQLRINENIPDLETRFKRLSIPIVRRIMNSTEINSHFTEGSPEQFQKTSLKWFPDSVRSDLDFDAEECAYLARALTELMVQFAEKSQKPQISLLGLFIDENNNFCYFYDWN